jgi:hypothetical protein
LNEQVKSPGAELAQPTADPAQEDLFVLADRREDWAVEPLPQEIVEPMSPAMEPVEPLSEEQLRQLAVNEGVVSQSEDAAGFPRARREPLQQESQAAIPAAQRFSSEANKALVLPVVLLVLFVFIVALGQDSLQLQLSPEATPVEVLAQQAVLNDRKGFLYGCLLVLATLLGCSTTLWYLRRPPEARNTSERAGHRQS